MSHYTAKQKPIKIHVGYTTIGRVSKGVFLKHVRSRHFLTNPLAIAFAVESLDEAERGGAHLIAVKDGETGRTYRTDFDTFKLHSFEVDRGGFERQRAMRLEHWTIKGSRRKRSQPESAAAMPTSSIAWQPASPGQSIKAEPAELNADESRSGPIQLDLFGSRGDGQ